METSGTTAPTVPIVRKGRALRTGFVAAVLSVFNYGTNVTGPSEAILAVGVYLSIGYLSLTAMALFFDRLL